MSMEVIVGRTGNQAIQITNSTVSRRHCKITDNGDGQYTVENLSPAGTIVNGHKIVRTVVTADTEVQLGPEFRATVGELVKCTPPVPPATGYDISHLERVWNEFNETNIRILERRRKINMLRAALPLFTISAMIFTALASEEYKWMGIVFTVITFAFALYSFMGMKADESPRELQKRQEKFESQWICPNPSCGCSLPTKNYHLLGKNFKKCNYCGCIFKKN